MGAPTSSAKTFESDQSDDARRITTSVLASLGKHLSECNFSVQLWDVSSIPAKGESRFSLVLSHPGAMRRMFWPPGELTLAQAYLRNDFDVEGDIIGLMEMAQELESISISEWISILRQVRKLPTTNPPNSFDEGRQPLELKGLRHSRERDEKAVTYHYDTGNEFYRLFLGKWMAYSCAYFSDPTVDLDRAQEAKFDLICRKLRLRPGERFLDIGCGWGGLAVYAAEKYKVEAVGINLSQPQIDFGRLWIEKAGLTGQASIEKLDYRDVRGKQPFDKIASIGMVEHVGREKLEEYFRTVLSALRPGGLFLNHAIGTHRLKPDNWAGRTFLQQGQFLQKYVFPDGELVNINEMLSPAERMGFEVRDVESLREHYALTLRNWIANLEANEEKAVDFTDERTYRTWRLYMAASVRGFESGNITVFQSLLSNSRQGSSELPLSRKDIYKDFQW